MNRPLNWMWLIPELHMFSAWEFFLGSGGGAEKSRPIQKWKDAAAISGRRFEAYYRLGHGWVGSLADSNQLAFRLIYELVRINISRIRQSLELNRINRICETTWVMSWIYKFPWVVAWVISLIKHYFHRKTAIQSHLVLKWKVWVHSKTIFSNQ